MLWWPFGLRRQGCTGEMSDSSEETYNCYAPPPKKKKKNPPQKALCKHRTQCCNRDRHKENHTHRSVPTKAKPGLCLPDLLFTDLPSLCTALLSIPSLLCTSPLSPFPSLILEGFPPICPQFQLRCNFL